MSTATSAPIVLKSDRLVVEIAPPGTLYTRTRFDWTAFITQVTLDGTHTFCVPEDPDPAKGTGGIGLCNEFGIEKAIGYDDCPIGECFPKLGIGVLERTDNSPYSFLHPYHVAAHSPIQIETTDSEVRFEVEPIECRGYAARLIKTVTADDTTLKIAYRLENLGQKAIQTTEYCHNFVGLDEHLLGPDYALRLPYEVRFEEPPPAMLRRALPGFLRTIVPDAVLAPVVRLLMRRSGQVLTTNGPEISLREMPQRPFYRRLIGYTLAERPQWELIHTPSGVGMREIDDFAPCRLALWGTTHVISAEVFCPIDVQPGETQTWTRRYEFFA